MPKLIIILNGVSRKKKKFYHQLLPEIKQAFEVEVWETQHQQHAVELGAKAVQQNPYGVLAAGGDGTLNQVLNGVLQQGAKIIPAIGIIPLGTGNDFARLCNIKASGKNIVKKLLDEAKPTDIGKIVCVDDAGKSATRYFINVASLGMGPAVVNELYKSTRAWGPTLTYLRAIMKVFFAHKPEPVELTTENWEWRGNTRVVAIANGQSFGGGIFIAPHAQPDDGVFSTFVAGNLPLPNFLLVLQKIKMKIMVRSSQIQYNTCTSISLTSHQPCSIETEGELAGLLPAFIELMPKAIRFFR